MAQEENQTDAVSYRYEENLVQVPEKVTVVPRVQVQIGA